MVSSRDFYSGDTSNVCVVPWQGSQHRLGAGEEVVYHDIGAEPWDIFRGGGQLKHFSEKADNGSEADCATKGRVACE